MYTVGNCTVKGEMGQEKRHDVKTTCIDSAELSIYPQPLLTTMKAGIGYAEIKMDCIASGIFKSG